MLGKILGAVVGKRLAQGRGGVSGPGGALLGAGAAAALRRMGPMGFAAAMLGGWAVKRHFNKQQSSASDTGRRRSR